jgi:hypothetical protein
LGHPAFRFGRTKKENTTALAPFNQVMYARPKFLPHSLERTARIMKLGPKNAMSKTERMAAYERRLYARSRDRFSKNMMKQMDKNYWDRNDQFNETVDTRAILRDAERNWGRADRRQLAPGHRDAHLLHRSDAARDAREFIAANGAVRSPSALAGGTGNRLLTGGGGARMRSLSAAARRPSFDSAFRPR